MDPADLSELQKGTIVSNDRTKKDTANLYLLICMANFVASELFLLHIMQMTLCGTHLWSFETRYRDLKTFLIHELSSQEISVVTLKVSKFQKQIMVPKLLPKNKPSLLSWKITTSRLIQKRVYLLAKRT